MRILPWFAGVFIAVQVAPVSSSVLLSAIKDFLHVPGFLSPSSGAPVIISVSTTVSCWNGAELICDSQANSKLWKLK